MYDWAMRCQLLENVLKALKCTPATNILRCESPRRTALQGAQITAVNETTANCWYADNKGKNVSTEFRGVFPHQNILGFPGALYRLNIRLSVTTLLNRTALCALHQKPFCAAYILYLITVLFFYYTVVFSSNFYVVLTSFFQDVFRGWDIFSSLWKTVVFSHVLNNTWVW